MCDGGFILKFLHVFIYKEHCMIQEVMKIRDLYNMNKTQKSRIPEKFEIKN